MSTPRSANTPNLCTLPPHILTKILTYLRNDIEPHPYRNPLPLNFPTLQHSLNLQKCLTNPIPSALLPIATVSPVLARAAASVTRAHHTYLTPQTTGYQLHQWVRALAPFVKGVAFDDYVFESLTDFTGPVRGSLYNNLLSNSLQLFNALSTNLVRLEVLDLVHLPFHVHRSHDALLSALYTTLESNSATLRELALPAYAKSDLCARALELATLRRLEVFTVDLRDKPATKSEYVKCQPIFRMLQALDGHADRALGITKVHDLRLMNDTGVLRIEARSGLSKSFFESVQILRLKTVPQLYSGFYDPCFGMFPNLKCLYWNKIPRVTHEYYLEISHVREVHYCHVCWFTLPQLGTEEVGDRGEFDCVSRKVEEYLELHEQPCLRTIMVSGLFNPFYVACMSNCRNLENLSFMVCPENVKGLRSVLRRCRRIRVLELVLDEIYHEQLENDDWYTIAKAVKASNSLSQFGIVVRDENARIVTFVNAVVNCCVAAVESLGSRARRLVFRVTLNPRRIVPIYNGVSKILNACKEHTPALEFLKVDLFVPRFGLQDGNIEETKRAKRKFIFAKEELLGKIESLRGLVDFGFLNKVFDEQRYDAIETVKRRSLS